MYSESRDNKPPTIVEEDETPKRNRPPDLQGFTILDERWKSCSDDSDDSLPASGSYISSPSAGRFCKSVDFRTLQRNTTASSTPPAPVTQPSTPTLKNPPSRSSLSSTMASGGSRFKIVPVETRYKRNRWSCYDYYDHRDPFFTRVTKHSHQTPAAALKKEEIVNRSSRSLSDIHPVPAVAATPPAAPIKPQAAPTNLPKPVYVAPRASLPPAPTKVANNSHTFTNGSHAQTIAKNAIKASNENSESLNGLQTSLTNEPEQRRVKSAENREKTMKNMWHCHVGDCNHIPMYSPHYGISRGCSPSSSSRTSSYSVTASPPAHQLNIDSKIEQAMDLVKTHLMFAVREEVDGLKGKISELENHVNRLEAENSILKKTLPNDVLQKLHLKL